MQKTKQKPMLTSNTPPNKHARHKAYPKQTHHCHQMRHSQKSTTLFKTNELSKPNAPHPNQALHASTKRCEHTNTPCPNLMHQIKGAKLQQKVPCFKKNLNSNWVRDGRGLKTTNSIISLWPKDQKTHKMYINQVHMLSLLVLSLYIVSSKLVEKWQSYTRFSLLGF